jgi:hypothetical protein
LGHQADYQKATGKAELFSPQLELSARGPEEGSRGRGTAKLYAKGGESGGHKERGGKTSAISTDPIKMGRHSLRASPNVRIIPGRNNYQVLNG